jgi:hypothetical protein
MIRKTSREFKRTCDSWDDDSFKNGAHTEVVHVDTWWLFWFIPIYSREWIRQTNIV